MGCLESNEVIILSNAKINETITNFKVSSHTIKHFYERKLLEIAIEIDLIKQT